MSSNASEVANLQAFWEEASADRLDLDASGRIVDFLEPGKTRADKPEERVRQSYARILVEEYKYAREWLAFEAPIHLGSETKHADIVVYDSPESRASRNQGRILLIIETKAPTKSEGQAQLVSYIFASSASGGVWTNGGTDPIAYFRRVEHPHAHLKEWTNIPRCDETWETVGRYKKSDLDPPHDLKKVFRRCHNAVYKTGMDSEDIALDMVRVILAKYRDEQNPGELCEFRCAADEFDNQAGRLKVKDRIQVLFRQVASDHPTVFAPGDQITMGEDSLAVVVNELQPFKFLSDEETEQVYDVIGTAFEVYVAAHLKGARGQYFTNRLVINLMVEILDPTERDLVLDPAVGSGGFLIAALRYIRQRILKSSRTRSAKIRELRNVTERLFGVDISNKLVRVAKTNMILNGDGHGGIVQGNSLRALSLLPAQFPFRTPSRKPTLIFTNPPFGASHELRERNREVLDHFQLGHVWEKGDDGWLEPTEALDESNGLPPETLFLERCIELLPPGGKLAIVIARGLLDNREAVPARQYVLKRTRLLGVINCHPNTFAPFNGTKASVLVLEKKSVSGIQRNENYPVFMAVSQKIGQDSQGHEIFRTTDDGGLLLVEGQRVLDHDMTEIARAWQQHREGKKIKYPAAWSVPLSKILVETEMRFNPVRYAPTAEQALARVLELADSPEWKVERLGDFATVFNGPRFKRPFAADGVRSGPGVIRMFTPKAFFEERGESSKYLDTSHATRVQRKAVDVLTLKRDWILIVDSGTAGKLLGRVGMTTAVHEGSVGNNNIIRVVIGDPTKRDYVYQYLRSGIGQTLLLRNVYGTNQDHIEPDDVKDIPVVFPRDERELTAVSGRVREVIELRERTAASDEASNAEVRNIIDRAFSATSEVPILKHSSKRAGRA